MVVADTASKRGNLPKDLGPYSAWIDSFALSLRVAEKSANTIRIYTDAAGWLAGWLLLNAKVRSWDQVSRDELRQFFVHMQEIGYEQGYRNNIARGLQAFFKWFAEEEEVPDPFKTFRPPPPPKIGEKTPDVISKEDLKALVKDAESGRDFEAGETRHCCGCSPALAAG
ncbi:hypothetical protein [Micromonospora sp. NPDC023956]|uniref:hypothetical protein n=1 Tax=Micromonospora sp. NPDC023956 TaxID=3155722 RepID=UPI0033F60CB6